MTEDEFKARHVEIERQGNRAFTAAWNKHAWLLYTTTVGSLVVVLVGMFSPDLTWHQKALGAVAEAVYLLFLWLYWTANAEYHRSDLMYALTLSDLAATASDPEETTEQ